MKWGNTHGVKIKGCSRIYYASADIREARLAILITVKAKAERDLIKRDKEGNYILIKDIIMKQDY